MVLHISAYSIRCILSEFPATSRRVVIRARVGDDILDLCGLLIALATLDATTCSAVNLNKLVYFYFHLHNLSG